MYGYTAIDDSHVSYENNIDTEFKALESEYFGFAITISDFGAPYSIALEDSSTSTFGAQLKNYVNRGIAFLRRIFEAIPKFFQKLGRMIKHSKMVTKMRADKGLPDDVKKALSKDKVAVIKQLRFEILEAKQKLIEVADKKIEKASYIMEELNREMESIIRIINTGEKARTDVINGKFDVSQTKIDKLYRTFDQLQGLDTASYKETLNKKLEKLKASCANDTIYAYVVPQYTGTDKSAQITSQIERDSTNCANITETLDRTIRNNVTFKEFFSGSMAKLVGSKVGTDEESKDKMQDQKWHMYNIPQKQADIAKLDRYSKILTSGVAKIINLYSKSSKHCLDYCKEYCEICAMVYKVESVPEGGIKSTELKAPEQQSGKTTSNYQGQLKWSDKQGCWVYERVCINSRGEHQTFWTPMTNEKDKETKPKLSVEIKKQADDEIKKAKDFKEFVKASEENRSEE